MPEIKKRIVIASVLKPVSDTRMTEKIAATLAQDDTLEVHVIGYPSSPSPNEKITSHSFDPFERLSFRRLATPLKIFRIVRKLNPSILIVTTHELLGIALLMKLLTRTKVIYDVQENYYLNILHTNAFNPLLKYPIAAYVRLKETLAGKWVDHFLLAEEIYRQQLTFARDHSTVLANKATHTFAPLTQIASPFKLIFSGTLSRSTGVFEAIRIAKNLHKIEPGITLTIIGYAALDKELYRIQAEIQSSPFISLIGGNSHVNHEEIVKAIASSGAGIVAYENNPATEGRIPTKLYEYVAHSLPILFTRNYPQWEHFTMQSNLQFAVLNASHPDFPSVINWLAEEKARGTINESVLWKSEENKLATAISALK
jgi:glycosyltransferase involved in cell wall biosynthesis